MLICARDVSAVYVVVVATVASMTTLNVSPATRLSIVLVCKDSIDAGTSFIDVCPYLTKEVFLIKYRVLLDDDDASGTDVSRNATQFFVTVNIPALYVMLTRDV